MPARSDRTRDRLFSAAAELIGERGFHGTTVDDIVERAGVAKGTVYYHFKSKSELFDALLTDHLTRLASQLADASAAAPTATEALAALVDVELRFIHENQAASKLFMSEVWRADREWSETLRVLRESYGTVIAGVLRRGVETGEFRPDLDVPLAASLVFGTVATGALDWLVFTPGRRMTAVRDAVAAMVLHAVTP